MEFVSGIRIRDIFLDNGNWWKFFLKNVKLIRISIIVNVLKMLVCRTPFMGHHLFVCPTCGNKKKVPHSCKSRFCSSCGKKATDNWIKTKFNTLPHTTWQHITFTMPAQLWDFFWVNRHLMNKLPSIAAGIIMELAREKGFLPGIFIAIHTFGRDLKRNMHFHLSTTIGGLSLSYDKWIDHAYFHHQTLKNMWKYRVITLLRDEFKAGRLKMPPGLKHITTYSTFYSWTAVLYRKTWVVHLNEQSDNMKNNVEYLGRYLKRPPLGETRIQEYNGQTVTFKYLDHYTNTQETMQLPVLDFIARLISHIPDRYFRNIRYYGFLSNRLSGKLLPIVYRLLKMNNAAAVSTSWREMIKKTFRLDPLICSCCHSIMLLTNICFPSSKPILSLHKEIANGFFPLL